MKHILYEMVSMCDPSILLTQEAAPMLDLQVTRSFLLVDPVKGEGT